MTIEVKSDRNFDVPEICRPFNIDWSTYTPPGGDEWLTYFVETVQPTFTEALANAKRELAREKEAEARRNAIRKGLEAANAIAKMVYEFNEANPNEIKDSMVQTLAAWTVASKALVENDPFCNTDIKGTVKMFEEDIKFLTAVKDFFSNDLELDAVLHAMYKVEPKYKAKLFRHVMRLMPIVETNRTFIERADSVIRKHTWDIFEPAIRNLDEAYAILSPQLRKMKKAAANASPDFWETVR